MSWTTAVVLIVIALVVGGIMRERYNALEGRPKEHSGDPLPSSQRERELQSEVEELRERVKVLERIATDPARRTAEAIENLRDEG